MAAKFASLAGNHGVRFGGPWSFVAVGEVVTAGLTSFSVGEIDWLSAPVAAVLASGSNSLEI